MSTKFSQDVIPLTDVKVNPGKVVKHATESGRPVLLLPIRKHGWASPDVNSTMTVSFALSAVEDLESLRSWYTEQGVPQVGERAPAGTY